MDKYLCYADYPVGNLRAARFVQQLPEHLQQYTAELALAGYACWPIICQQISEESLAIHKFLAHFVTRVAAEKSNQTKLADNPVFKSIIEYAGQFYYQAGNFQGYGDTKFIPRCSYDDLYDFVCEHGMADCIPLLEPLKKSMWSLSKPIIAFPPDGQTQYYSPDISAADAKELDKLHGLMVENTTIRSEKERYVIEVAAIQQRTVETGKEYKGKRVVVEYGKYARFLQNAVRHLEKAIEHTRDDTQKAMLRELVMFYQTGDMQHHLEYSKLWVKGANPLVETYQGFIETYRDPLGVRAEMENLVAVVDPESSRMLEALLEKDNMDRILHSLPVPEFLHRTTFVPPAYKGLEVVAFPTCGFPIGINIPNYDCIRQQFGFKNVSLENVMAARVTTAADQQYLPSALQERCFAEARTCLEAEVALHELYGHGSCRLIYQADYEKLAPSDKELLKGFYQSNETFYGCFGPLQSAFEECRAEVTAYYLNSLPLVHEIFKVVNKKDYLLSGVYSAVLGGVLGLMQYDVKTKKWLQAHSQARFLIVRNMMKAEAVKVEFRGPSMEFLFDENKFPSVFETYKELIRTLNVLKAGKDVDGANRLFDELSTPDEFWLKVREVALANKKPRMSYVPGVIREKDGKLEIADAEYDEKLRALAVADTYVHNILLAEKVE